MLDAHRQRARIIRLLLLITIVLLNPLAALAQSQQPALVIYEPFGPQSVTDDAVQMLKPDLESELKGPVEVRHQGGAAGGAAMATLRDAPADGRTLVAVELTTRLLHEALHPEDKPTLSELTPIALVTDGISVHW